MKKFGGAWIDATCFLTQPLDQQLSKLLNTSEFFAFMYEKPMISNWFLVARKNSYIIDLLLETLLEYWNSYLDHKYYFCFHALFYSLYIKDEKFRTCVDNVSYISTKIPHKFQFNMMNQNNDEIFNEMINSSFIHKLTYKFDDKLLNGSYLEKLLKITN